MKRWRPMRGDPTLPPAAALPIGEASATIGTFLSDLQVLRGVPLSYLVPYPEMLPPETLCFFYIDPNWMAALYQGALSLSGYPPSLMPALPSLANQGQGVPVFGFLLNSQLVSQFPNTIYTAKVQDQVVTPLRLEPLSSTVLIGLYDSVLTSLQLSQPVESFLLGLDVAMNNNGVPTYSQLLRYFQPPTTAGQGQLGSISAMSVALTPRSASAPATRQVMSFDAMFQAMSAKVGQYPTVFQQPLQTFDFGLQIIFEATTVTIAIAPAAT